MLITIHSIQGRDFTINMDKVLFFNSESGEVSAIVNAVYNLMFVFEDGTELKLDVYENEHESMYKNLGMPHA